MKKGMFFALAASSLLFSACSSDDAVVSTEGQNEAVQQIVLHVASSGDGLSTRAGRPLYSSQALQTIQNVRVIIYKDDATKTIVKDKQLNWKDSKRMTIMVASLLLLTREQKDWRQVTTRLWL